MGGGAWKAWSPEDAAECSGAQPCRLVQRMAAPAASSCRTCAGEPREAGVQLAPRNQVQRMSPRPSPATGKPPTEGDASRGAWTGRISC